VRVLIAEEALETGAGHWPSYIGTVCDGLRAAGHEVEVLGHKNASATLREQLGVRPFFSRNCWLDPASQGILGGLRHNFKYRSELKKRLSEAGPRCDWILALTMRIQHLLAYGLLSRTRFLKGGSRALLLFVQGFGKPSPDGEGFIFPSSGSTQLARFSFRLMAPAVREGRVVLAAETRGMQAELEAFTGLPVSLFPHPVPEPEELPPARNGQAPFRITAPGFARHEKGTDLLQAAILELLDDPAFAKAEFVLQWKDPIEMPDGTVLSPDATLLDHPRVRFENQPLNGKAYLQLIADSSLILLPYRKSSYYNRLSRVAIEAAGRGKPLVATAGTWTEEIIEAAGAGYPFVEESGPALAAALKEAVGTFSAVETTVRENAASVARFHSGPGFARLLAEKGVS
jgi:glycosyltransferase involved in cell wall biosynthesis